MKIRRSFGFTAIFFAGIAGLAANEATVAQSPAKPAVPGGPGGTGPSRWVQIESWGPAGRLEHAMAYDSARDRVVLFTGRGYPDGEFFAGGTWELDGSNWIERSPATSPPWLAGYAMAYDSARGRVVLFGGSRNQGMSAGTWEWDGSNWADRTPATSPSPRSSHAMVYDSARGRVVLFGGGAADTWEWDGTNWVELTPDTTPPALAAHAMAYDSLRERVVLFGGVEQIGPDEWVPRDATWEWDGSDWVEVPVEPNVRPSARADHAMAFDSARGRVLVFGGTGSSGYLRDTWELIEGTRWAPAGSAGPDERTSPAMVYDSLRERALVFGGYGYNARYKRRGGAIWYSDTWEFLSKPRSGGESLPLGRE